MKVTFSYPTRTLSGKQDDTVFGSYRNDNLCLARKYVYPEITEHNHIVGSIVKNLAVVYSEASPDYVQDLKTYAKRNGKENVPNNQIVPQTYSLFIKMMYNWQKSDPTHVDLAAVTIADIVALDADVRTIARAVSAGFLPNVSVSADLTSEIQ